MKKPYRIIEEDFPEYEVLSVRTKDSLRGMGRHIRTLYAEIRQKNLEKAGPIFAVYHEMPENPESVDYEMFMPVAGPGEVLDSLTDFGGDRCLKLRHKGSYSKLNEAYAALDAEVERRGLATAGPPREVYTRGPLCGFFTFIPTMVTDIYYPVKEK